MVYSVYNIFLLSPKNNYSFECYLYTNKILNSWSRSHRKWLVSRCGNPAVDNSVSRSNLNFKDVFVQIDFSPTFSLNLSMFSLPFRISVTRKTICLLRWSHSLPQERYIFALHSFSDLLGSDRTVRLTDWFSLQPKAANVLGAVNKPLSATGKLQTKLSRMETISNASSNSNPSSPGRSKGRLVSQTHIHVSSLI